MKSTCFPDEAKDVFSEIRNPSGVIESVEELPAKPIEGWTPLTIRMVVDGQELLIDRHLTGPYMIYSDKIDRMLGGNLAELHANRSSQTYCFNLLLGDNDPSGDN